MLDVPCKKLNRAHQLKQGARRSSRVPCAVGPCPHGERSTCLADRIGRLIYVCGIGCSSHVAYRRRKHPTWELQAILDDVRLSNETQKHKFIGPGQKCVCGSMQDISRVWLHDDAKGIVVCHNCKTQWFKAWNRYDIAKKDRSVRRLFFDQWSAFRLTEFPEGEKVPAFRFYEVYKPCMRCQNQARRRPSLTPSPTRRLVPSLARRQVPKLAAK
jgi:hypothetical protein